VSLVENHRQTAIHQLAVSSRPVRQFLLASAASLQKLSATEREARVGARAQNAFLISVRDSVELPHA
jgi:hypothetical protein